MVDDKDDGLSAGAKAYQAAGPWMDVAWRFFGSVLFCTAVGYGLDVWRGAKNPWGLLAGALIGCTVGFYTFYVSAMKLIDGRKKTK
jgi:F0F1-type ATP synthase assembly protein I